MALDAYPMRCNVPDVHTVYIRGLGANGAALTLQEGARGVTCTRTGEGAYTLTWSENPGTLVGFLASFGAATPADMKGYTCTRDTQGTNALDIAVWDSAFAAADVIADQYIDLQITFRRSGVQ